MVQTGNARSDRVVGQSPRSYPGRYGPRNEEAFPLLRVMTAFTVLLLLFLIRPVHAADYYLTATGDDRDTGLSSDHAWRTLDRVNQLELLAGDRILLEAGTTFLGPLLLDGADRGTESAPITVTTFGNGPAVIEAGEGMGIFVRSTAGVILSNLHVSGNHHPHNNSDGIAIHNDLDGALLLTGITIDHVEVSGFGKNGISIGGWNGDSGFRNVRVTHTRIHDNGLNGLVTYAQHPRANKDVYIAYVEAYRNTGLPGVVPHSGSGIILGNVENGVIEWSKAYENGRLGNAGVGIWTYDSTKVVIQHNESFANRTSGEADGGGFDLDGGVTDSVMQHNFSHDNDGAGYGLYEYAEAPPWYGNTVRHNLSVNDGRKNGAAGIQIWNGGTSLLADATIHDNIVMMGPSEDVTPSAIAFKSPSQGFSIYQNAFIASGEAILVFKPAEQVHLHMSDNRCWSMTTRSLWDESLEREVCAIYFRFPG